MYIHIYKSIDAKNRMLRLQFVHEIKCVITSNNCLNPYIYIYIFLYDIYLSNTDEHFNLMLILYNRKKYKN